MEEADLSKFFSVLRRRLWVPAVVVGAALLVSGLASYFFLPTVYAASTTLIVKRAETPLDYTAVLLDQQLAKTYGEIAKSREVAAEVIRQLSLSLTFDEWQEMVEVRLVRDTQLLVITVEHTDPIRAAVIANTLSRVFIDRVTELMQVNNVAVVDRARVPGVPVRPRPALNMLVAAAAAAMAGLALVFALERLDHSVNTPEDVERYLGLPVLAAIPLVRGEPGTRGPAVESTWSQGGDGHAETRLA